MDKLIFKTPAFWFLVYGFLTTITIVVMSFMIAKHRCPQIERPIITEITQQQIKRIGNAETKDDIDSLLFELYNFRSK